MSTIKKLHIRGIRSFDPQEGKAQVMEFFSPVTLIVGQNGSGKTTIIEALKYAITSCFPPGTDNGRSFVNDPKLSSGFEVLAQVKLEITDTQGNTVHCTRRMKLTQQGKNNTCKFSTLEGTLRSKGKDGQYKDISAKCVDMKVEMGRFMGVSEAILNYVIFCHQEDSCWPLDEGKKVKERFDAIFNTTGYMTSLKHLDTKDKDLAEKMKIENQAFTYAQRHVVLYRKKKNELEELKIQSAALADTEKKFEKEKSEIISKLKVVEEIVAKLAQFTAEVSVCKEKVTSGERQIADLRERIKDEFKGDVKELNNVILHFKQNLKQKQEDVIELEKKSVTKDRELNTLRQQQQGYVLEEGKFKQEEASITERLETAKSIGVEVLASIKKMKELSQEHSSTFSVGTIDSFIEAFEENIDSVPLESIIKAISSAGRHKDLELQKTKIVLDQREKELQDNIDVLRSNRVALEKSIEIKQEQINDNKMASDKLRERLISINSSNDALALLNDDEASHTEKINEIEQSGIISKCEEEIKVLNKELLKSEESLVKVSKQMDLLRKDETKTQQIAMFNRQKLHKQNACNDIMRRIEDQLEMILGTVPEKDLMTKLKKKATDLKNDIESKQRELQTKERENSKCEVEYRQVKRELERKEKEFEEWQEQVTQVLEGADFHETCKEIEDIVEKAQQESYLGEAAEFLYVKYIKQLHKKASCPLCKKALSNRNEVQTLQNDIQKKVDDMKVNRPNQQENIQKLKEKQQGLALLKPNWEEKTKLGNEVIPELRNQRTKLEERIEALKETLEGINETLGIFKSDYAVATGLTADVTLYEQHKKDVTKFEEDINKCEGERDPAAKACPVSLQDAKIELETLQGKIRSKRFEKESKDALRGRKRDELAHFQTEKNKVQAEKLRITSEFKNRESLEAQKRKLDDNNKVLQTEIRELTKQIPAAKNEITEAEKAKKNFLVEKEAQLQQIRNDKVAFDGQLRILQDIKKQEDSFKINKSKFAGTQRKIAECKLKVSNLEEELENIRKKIDAAKAEINTQESKERDLDDNLKLKSKQAELVRCRQELTEKQKHLVEAEQKGGVDAQKRELDQQYRRAEGKLYESRGRCGEIKKQCTALEKELEEQFGHAEADFKERLIKKTVYEKALYDIRRYKKALDRAIMTFHTKRMESINRTLKKYWQQIYKGNDIELIQIRTEDADPMKAEKKIIDLKATRKSYNYRVVMIRRGIELDMRGRCSAGQKVLASIIIRIALAEAFSSKCGVLSLDEPTTNLDEPNICALADCLALIAERMSQNKTFQLIVITHDQNFMDRLLGIDQIEQYYRVKRDSRGYSQIVQVTK